MLPRTFLFLVISAVIFGSDFPIFCQISSYQLTKEQEKAVSDYADQMSIEDGVGQLLMVGIPFDSKNYINHPQMNKLIRDMRIGNFFVNDYNTKLSKNRSINNSENKAMITMLNEMQALAYKNYSQNAEGRIGSGIPLLIGSDFEGATISEESPVKHGLMLPPNSLTLSTCYDSNLIRLAGKTVGFQLLSSGIHVLLGPVLDIATKFNITMQNRIFGSTPEIVYKRASHFIIGLQEAGIIVIGKHYPSHNIISNENMQGNSAYSGTPEKSRMYYNGSIGDFKNEPLGYSGFNKLLDGVMTSHLVLGFLQHSDEDIPVTVSNYAVEELLRKPDFVRIKVRYQEERELQIKGLGFKDQIIMTDDLSNMGAILGFMKKSQKTFADIAINSFDAGHDILLYAHLKDRFSIKELGEVRDALIEHIHKNSSAKKHFREALRRVLLVKAKINAKIGDGSNQFPNNIKQWSASADFEPTRLPLNSDIKYNRIDNLYQAIYDKATICLNKNTQFNLSQLSSDTRLLFATDFRVKSKFENAFKNRFSQAIFLPIPMTDVMGRKDSIVKQLADLLPSVNCLIFTMVTRQHKEILVSLLQKNDEFCNKIIVFLHNNPSVLDAGSIADDISEIPKQRLTLIGNFDHNENAFESDIKVLQGIIKPSSIRNNNLLPVSITGLYNANEYSEPWLAASGFDAIPFYNTEREKQLSQDIGRLNDSVKVLNQKVSSLNYVRYIFLFSGLALLCFSFVLVGKKYINFYKKFLSDGAIKSDSKWYSKVYVLLVSNGNQTWKYSVLLLLTLISITILLNFINPEIINYLWAWVKNIMIDQLKLPTNG